MKLKIVAALCALGMGTLAMAQHHEEGGGGDRRDMHRAATSVASSSRAL